MEQKRIARMLKALTVCVAGFGILFTFWYLPHIIRELGRMAPEAAWLSVPGTIGVWAIGLLILGALACFYRICSRIGENNSFSLENAKDMKSIGVLAAAVAILIIGGAVFLGIAGFLSAPALLLGIFMDFGAWAVCILCMALSLLIKNAAEIKAENDLTI